MEPLTHELMEQLRDLRAKGALGDAATLEYAAKALAIAHDITERYADPWPAVQCARFGADMLQSVYQEQALAEVEEDRASA